VIPDDPWVEKDQTSDSTKVPSGDLGGSTQGIGKNKKHTLNKKRRTQNELFITFTDSHPD